MKWFKHDSDASDDIKIKRLEEEFKNDGYAIFFKTIEIVAKEGEKGRISFQKYPQKWLSQRCHVSEEKIQEIYGKMAELGLLNRKSLNRGVLHLPNFSSRADNYSKYGRRDFKDPLKELSVEEKRIEEEKKRLKERIEEHFKYFVSKHLLITGIPYQPSYGKDKKLLHELADVYDKDTLNQLIDEFFDSSKDPKTWWADKLSVGVFKHCISQIIGRLRKK